jgi:hypothetical protein
MQQTLFMLMLDPICVTGLLIFVDDRKLPVGYCISYYLVVSYI